MKNASKKIVSLLLCVLLLAMVVPLSAIPVVADRDGVSGVQYDIFGGAVIITGCTEDAPSDLVIPATIEGYPVTAIEDHAFDEHIDLTSVTIPDGVTEIGSNAFYGCTSLTFVTIPNTVKEIGEAAFADCKSLTSVTIPKGIKVVEDYMFAGCKNLTSVTIPDGVREIGYMAFADCKSLTTVTIPESVSDISAEAFDGCTDLTDVYYGGTERAFEEVYVGDTNYYLLDATWYYNASAFHSTDKASNDDASNDDTSGGPWLWVGISGGVLLIGGVLSSY